MLELLMLTQFGQHGMLTIQINGFLVWLYMVYMLERGNRGNSRV